MKRLSIFVIALCLLVVVALAAEEKPWFDLEHCDFCKHLTTDPGLLDHMTWQHYNISNGALSVTTVSPEYKDSYLKAQQMMEETGKEMMEGKPVNMCGSCEAYGQLMMDGVKFEHISTNVGDIVLMTSDKPELIEKIHAFAQKNNEELKKWEKVQKGQE